MECWFKTPFCSFSAEPIPSQRAVLEAFPLCFGRVLIVVRVIKRPVDIGIVGLGASTGGGLEGAANPDPVVVIELFARDRLEGSNGRFKNRRQVLRITNWTATVSL